MPISRNPSVRLSFNILILVAFACLLFYLAYIRSWYFIFAAIGLLWSIYNIFNLFHNLYQKITFFFNAVENDDSTLYFPEDVKHRATKELNQGLNRMNRLIQEVRMHNRNTDQYYGVLLEQVATGVVVINRNGAVLQANSAAKRLICYEYFNHLEQLKRVDNTLFQSFKFLMDGNSSQFVKLKCDNQLRQLSLQATSVVNNNEELRIISIHDVGNELDAKELESWQKLIRVLTHEIMNSITPITSLSETILGYYNHSGEVSPKIIANTVKGLSVINERGAGLIKFVESYRSLTRLSKPVPVATNLNKLIEDVILLIENDIESCNAKFEISANDTFIVSCDATQITQVIINLLKNAVHAVSDTDNPRVIISLQASPDSQAVITVTDNGNGIPSDLIEQIFIPFFTTRENGSGIGLTLSRQIIKNHGGSISVNSQPGKTRFVVRI